MEAVISCSFYIRCSDYNLFLIFTYTLSSATLYDMGNLLRRFSPLPITTYQKRKALRGSALYCQQEKSICIFPLGKAKIRCFSALLPRKHTDRKHPLQCQTAGQPPKRLCSRSLLQRILPAFIIAQIDTDRL